MIRRPPRSPLFPYPPLFRSRRYRQAWHGGSLGLSAISIDSSDQTQAVYNYVRTHQHMLPNLRAIKGDNNDNRDRKSTRLNSSHLVISYAVFCLKKKQLHRLLHNRLALCDGGACCSRALPLCCLRLPPLCPTLICCPPCLRTFHAHTTVPFSMLT